MHFLTKGWDMKEVNICRIMEDMRNEAEYGKTIEIAHTFVLMGDLPYEKIAEGTGLSIEIIKELAEKKDFVPSDEKFWRTGKEKASAHCMIARGKLTLEEIAEDADLPIEVVRDLATCSWHKKFNGSAWNYWTGRFLEKKE